MSTSKNHSSSRASQLGVNTAAVATVAAPAIAPIVPIKSNEAIIDTILSPINNDLTPIQSGADVESSVLVFEGRAPRNALVNVFDNGTLVARVYATANGEWVWSANSFSGGEHKFSVQVQGQGNPVSASYDIAVPAGTEQPVEVLSALNDESYKLIKAGGTTNDTTPRFSGTATPNAIVKVIDGGREIGSVKSDANGNWEITLPLSGGEHELVFATEKSSSKPFPINIVDESNKPIEVLAAYDNEGPYTRFIASGDTTQDSTPRFSGRAGANTLIRLYEGDKLIGSTQSDAWGNWSLTPSLEMGSHNLVFKAGEGSVSKPFILNIASAEAQPIELTLIQDDSNGYYTKNLRTGDTTHDTTPRFSGKAGANVIVRLYDGENVIGSAKSDAWGNWSLTPSLQTGSHNLVFKAGEGSETKPFALTIASADAQPVEIYASLDNSNGYNSGFTPGSTIKDTTPSFYGKAGPNVIVRLYDAGKEIGSTKSDPSGNWNLTPTLSAGSHSLVFKAGEGSATQPFPLTIVAPESQPIQIQDVFDNASGYNKLLQPGASTFDTTPRFTGSAGPNVVIRLFDGEKVIGSTVSDSRGYWTLTPELSIGTHNLVFKTPEGIASTPYNLTITSPDPIKPQAPEIDYILDNVGKGSLVGKNGTTDDDTPTLSGRAAPNSLVEIFDNGIKIGERRVSASGNWEFTPVNPAYLENGKHSLVVKSNNGTESAAWDIVIKVPVSVSFVGSNSGEHSGPDGTEDSTPFLSGRGPKETLIRLFEGEKEIGSVVTGKDGSWKIDITDALSVGAHSVVAKVGNDNVSAQFDFTIIAPVAPVLPENPFTIGQVSEDFIQTGVMKANSETEDNQPFFIGSAPADSLVYIFDNGIVIGSVLADNTGGWGFEPATALSLGEHNITVGADASTASQAFTFKVIAADVVAPWVLGGISEHDGIDHFTRNAHIHDNTPVLNGVAVAGTTVFIAIDGKAVGSAVADEYGRWSFQTVEPLISGGHEVVATDASGKSGITLTFDVVAPENIAIHFDIYADNAGESLIGWDAVTNDSTPLLRGLAGQNIVLDIYDNGSLIGSVQTAQDGSWSYPLNLADGSHSIEVKGEFNDGPPARPFTVDAQNTQQLQQDAFTLTGISSVELLSDSAKTLLADLDDEDVQPATPLQLSQGDLSVISTSGVAETAAVAAPLLEEQQNLAI